MDTGPLHLCPKGRRTSIILPIWALTVALISVLRIITSACLGAEETTASLGQPCILPYPLVVVGVGVGVGCVVLPEPEPVVVDGVFGPHAARTSNKIPRMPIRAIG